MPNILPFVSKSLSFDKEAIKENKRNLKDPDYFRPSGIQTFFGEQGDGKTMRLQKLYFLSFCRGREIGVDFADGKFPGEGFSGAGTVTGQENDVNPHGFQVV